MVVEPGIEVGSAEAELAVGELDALRGEATGAHSVEGGPGHAEFVQDVGELELGFAAHGGQSPSERRWVRSVSGVSGMR